MIRDGRDFWAHSLEDWTMRPEIKQLVQQRRQRMRTVDQIDANADAAPIMINHGRIFARCWARGCGGAELVWLDDPKLWCTSCGNAELHGRWRPVAMPDKKTLALVDALMSVRPEVARNWRPWEESVGLLVADNIANGLQVPDDAPDPEGGPRVAHEETRVSR